MIRTVLAGIAAGALLPFVAAVPTAAAAQPTKFTKRCVTYADGDARTCARFGWVGQTDGDGGVKFRLYEADTVKGAYSPVAGFKNVVVTFPKKTHKLGKEHPQFLRLTSQRGNDKGCSVVKMRMKADIEWARDKTLRFAVRLCKKSGAHWIRATAS